MKRDSYARAIEDLRRMNGLAPITGSDYDTLDALVDEYDRGEIASTFYAERETVAEFAETFGVSVKER